MKKQFQVIVRCEEFEYYTVEASSEAEARAKMQGIIDNNTWGENFPHGSEDTIHGDALDINHIEEITD